MNSPILFNTMTPSSDPTAHFFGHATGHPPYPYQIRLANSPCQSRLINIPTGLGKTAAVTLAWLWNRVVLQQPAWPRRLVYCLPMRTLVEQTADNVRDWLQNVAQAASLDPSHSPQAASLDTSRSPQAASLELSPEARTDLTWLAEHSPIILMGGEDLDFNRKDWDLYPEKPAILIGTQDMLLSRALNRGYGMPRARWPMHFALLNNDCLWVMDEVQLMGPGLASTTQLEGFRKDPALGASTNHSWWMSATIRADWLATVDFPCALTASAPLALSEAEKQDGGRVQTLRNAPKQLIHAARIGREAIPKEVAAYIADNRSTDHLNLVVVNTVKRARLLHTELSKQLGKKHPAPILLHSQFRPDDRQRVLEKIRASPPGSIVVSTQVIEAGVDLSAHTLFTELAPWSSLVQRFGRCNRWLKDGRPQFEDARIHWFDLDEDKHSAPYDPAQLTAARSILTKLTDASLATLESHPSPDADRPVFRHVLRRKDLIDLFDTTPDLAGADLDIDRFVRDADSSHVQVFWRDWSTKTPNGDPDQNISAQPTPRREELCSTSIGDCKALLDKQSAQAWRWSYLDREWQPVKAEALIPGQTYLLESNLGGYDPDLGWTGEPKPSVTPLPFAANAATPDANEDDDTSETPVWQTLAQHTEPVCDVLNEFLSALGNDLDARNPDIALHDTLRHAARWHDWGKAHPAFQAKLIPEHIQAAQQQGTLSSTSQREPIAKAPKDAWKKGRLPKHPVPEDPRRRHFRHELASALGILHPTSGFPLDPGPARDLAAYLAAAHHGKVRLSIRSLPNESIPPSDPDHPTGRRFARGVWDADTLPACDLGSGVHAPEIVLSLEPMELGLCEAEPFSGQPSWAERTLHLRDTLGPFCLSFLETLLRAADGRASQLASEAKTNDDPDHESRTRHSQLAPASSRGKAPSAVATHSPGCNSKHGLRAGASECDDDSRNTRPDRATRYVETTQGILTYTELAPYLAERVTRIETEIFKGAFANTVFCEDLILDLHQRICGDLTPEWAGRWRTVDVAVGNLTPPPPDQVPIDMRNYCLDLQARCENASELPSLLELLAFAEGRFLSIHPFRDFNGRTIRLLLTELLRRLDLPPVDLVPQTEDARLAYFQALESADQNDLKPLVQIWQCRLELSNETEQPQ